MPPDPPDLPALTMGGQADLVVPASQRRTMVITSVGLAARPELPVLARLPTGTMAPSGAGSPRVGLLEDGRGLAATRTRVDGPGRRRTAAGENVETWVVGGRPATNRAGAAEYLRLAPNTVTVYSSPAGRRTHGWPEPLDERVNGQEVFALADLDAFAAARSGDRPPAPAVDDPDKLIGVDEFAALRGIQPHTLKRYVEDSLNAWDRGEDGYLPVPDDTEPARHGSTYRWRLDRAAAWIVPDARRTGGRKSGRRPQPDDLRQLLDEAGPGPRPTVRDLAASLTERLGTDVSSQTVRRLLRRLREEHPPQQ
jgi:hypothetical protein